MTEDVEENINAGKGEAKKIKINKAVSFNAIKNLAFEIFFSESDKDIVLEKLNKLFMMNPVLVRKDRQIPRESISDTRSANYHKRVRKHVF